VLLPIGFDQNGVDGPMQPFLDAARLMATGVSAAESRKTMRDRFSSGYYRPAARSGVSYMLAPLLRSYPDPVGSNRVLTVSVPHRMFYAPFVQERELGGHAPPGPQPYLIQPGIHGYLGQRAGPAERAAIVEEHREMLDRFCRLDTRWCLPP
jgi:hypothetical protein